MPKSLSEMQKSPDVGRPERAFPICVSGKLVAELEAIDRDLFEVEVEIAAEKERVEERREGGGKPTRMGERGKLPGLEKRAKALAEQADEVRGRMEDHTIALLLRGKTNGEWRQWATEHPARDEDEDKAGCARDRQYAALVCNIDALVTDLGQFIAKYGEEDPANGSWEFVADNAAPGDLTRLASTVVAMHEQVVDLGKSRSAWLASRRNATDSE